MRKRYFVSTVVLLSAVALALFLVPTMTPSVSAQPEGKTAPVNSRLKVRLAAEGKVSVKADEFPIELKFTNFAPDEKQAIPAADFTFAVLDKNGEQVNGGLISHHEPGEKIILRGPTTIVRPKLQFDPVVKAGGEYYFVCVIRNQSGLVKFTTKE